MGNEGHEGSSGTKGDEEEGGHEEEEEDEEEGGHEGHEGDEEEGGHEGHEGDEEEGSHEGHEGDEEEGGDEGHEGDEEEGSHEGHEGYEEEGCEQDCDGLACQGDGAPWQQSEDHWRLDGIGSDQEQGRQNCEQESERQGQEGIQEHSGAMVRGPGKGPQGLEDHGIRCDQEGLTPLRQGEGALQCVSAALSTGEASQGPAPAVGVSAAVERRSPSFYQLQ